MPAASPDEIVGAIRRAVQESGGSAIYLSRSPQAHPRVFGVSTPNGSFHLWVYIWTLTHGGRVSLPDEYRIQMTTVASPLQINPAGATVLLGYLPEEGMFAGFDLLRHRVFSTGSPSVQIRRQTLIDAHRVGLSFETKANDEIAIGIRPDQFLNYVRHARQLHSEGTSIVTALQVQTQPTP